jgi:hypothetical protein
MKSKKSTARQAEKLRRESRKLKALGLIKYDARRKPGRKEKAAVKKFRDVLNNKAAVIKVGKKEAKKYGRAFRAVKDKIIIPRKKGDRIRFDKKEKEIVITGKRYGKKTRIILEPGRGTKKRKGPKRGYDRWWAIPFGQGRNYFTSYKELREFMEEYKSAAIQAGRRWGFKNWRKYVEIIDVEKGEMPGEGDEGILAFPKERKK